MPAKIHSFDELRKATSAPPKINYREVELARSFAAFESLVLWMRARDCGEMIIVPLPPNMLNGSFSRAHFSTKSVILNQYKSHLRALQALALLPPPVVPTPDKVLCTTHLFVRSEMDDEGAFARAKMPIDFLVKAGYAIDDNRAHMEREIPQQTVTHSEPCRIEIRITPLAASSAGGGTREGRESE